MAHRHTIVGLLAVYRVLLRLPRFRGKGRLEHWARQLCFVPRRARVLHGLCMELDPVEWSQIELLRDAVIEPQTTTLYGRILRTGDTYIDVGAHVGFHTLVARHFVGSTGKVIAIDPQPYNCSKIMANWRANGFENLSIHVGAAGDRNGTVRLHDQCPSDKARLSLWLDAVNDEAQGFTAPLVRLDGVLDDEGVRNVALLKVDVEGYEPEVMAGLGDRWPTVRNIVIELLGAPDKLSERSLGLIEKLRGKGYQLATVGGRGWMPGDGLPENNLWASRAGGD